MSVISADTLVDAVASIEGVSSRIEDTFARVGGQLGRGHTIFQELNQSLSTLSHELSGGEIEGASMALQEIAERLNGLAEALPIESALLENIGRYATETSSLLRSLFKHIQMITIIARSARIEAASLDGDREHFLAFTTEAYELGKAVQGSIEGSARDQELLSQAIETALNRQKDFQQNYRAHLLSAGTELIAAYAEMRKQRNTSIHLADVAGTSTKKIAEAVGRSIISLQSGDATRQRLEHVGHGLRLAATPQPLIEPDIGGNHDGARVIWHLQAAQLKDAQQEFETDVGHIVRALSAILSDASDVVSQGRCLYGGEDGDSSSFLARIKQSLSQASTLIASCESAGKSVDDALTIVEETLGKFRYAISGLSEAVVDITLIGMNAGLKAAHLGTKGNAFVVIANALKASADSIASGASRLKPVLGAIEQSANGLRELRLRGHPSQLTKLVPTILHALREVEAGNDRLGRLISRLVRESAEFEDLMNSAQDAMRTLSDRSATLSAIAMRLSAAGANAPSTSLGPGDKMVLDELFARYTMERERLTHRQFMQRFGLAQHGVAARIEAPIFDDGVELF